MEPKSIIPADYPHIHAVRGGIKYGAGPDYTWPCDKRTAHGPHEIRSPECPDYDCPGVKAHPATMIGRTSGG